MRAPDSRFANGEYTAAVANFTSDPSGGAANMAGILYQVLRTLKTVASYSLARTKTQPLLIAEPKGGDLQVELPSMREVSQFKTKANFGTWSLATVIDKVLPDLYLAVRTPTPTPTRYLFVTDGRLGTWGKALDFFAELRWRSPEAGAELDLLDATQMVKFSREYSATERQLFQRVVDRVRTHPYLPAEAIATTMTKVWHLLSNFHLSELQTRDDADSEIKRLLRELGVAPGDVKTKRATLLGLLTELSAKSNTSFTPEELLSKAQLTGVPLSHFERHAAVSRVLFLNDVQRAGYTSAARLDRGIFIPADRQRVCFGGESGVGKSWAMTSAVERLTLDNAHLVVYVRATGEATFDFRDAAEKISRETLGRAQAASLRALALDVMELLPDSERVWLTICVDDVQSTREAEGLLVADREHDGVRVVFTAPKAVAEALRKRSDLAVIDVCDLSTAQLHEYLDKHGWQWTAVPADIRPVIHRPLLARLFVEVAGDPTWRGTTEYALYEATWERLMTGCLADNPQDVIRLRELALETARSDLRYPWTAVTLREAGVDDDVRRRLERTGWLRREADAGASIWHDRLLNWAVAEALVGAVRAGTHTPSEIGEVLVQLTPRFGSARFGYVAMDALWLASDDHAFSTDDLVTLLKALERPEAVRLSSLYEEFVPTIGARIIPALLQRLQEFEREDHVSPDIFSTSLHRAAGDAVPDDVIRSLLAHGNARVQDVALGHLAKSPRPQFLDAMWQLHISRQTLTDREWFIAYRASYAALAQSIRGELSWLKNRILAANELKEPVWDLAYLLAGLATDEGKQMWRELKHRLIEIVPLSHARSIVRCIHAYRDEDEIERLVELLPQEKDLAGAAAFAALANLDPERALSSLDELDLTTLGFARSWWMPWLLLAQPDRGRARLRERIASNPEHLTSLAVVYEGHHDAIDPETFELFLQQLVERISAYLDDADLTRPIPFYVLVQLLAKCSTLPQLRVMEGHRGDNVEKQLTALALLWIGQHYDRELRHLQKVLQRIGGGGYVAFARESLRRLGKEDYVSQLSVAEPCAESAVEELRATAKRFIDADQSERAYPLLLHAIRLLAATGDRDTIVDAAIKRTVNIQGDVPSLLAEHPPANKEKVDALVDRIAATAGDDRISAIYALGLTGHPDAFSHLAAVGREASDARERKAALYAFDALADESINPDWALIETKNLSDRFHWLFRIGTPDALDRIERELLAIAEPDDRLLDIGAALLDVTRGPGVAKWMWPHLQKKDVFLWHDKWWQALPYLPEGHDLLIEHAAGLSDDIRVNAAYVLASAEPAAATLVIEQIMRDFVSGHSFLAKTLLEINDALESGFLRDHLITDPDELCRMSIGRAFRRYPEVICELLPMMFMSPDAAMRRAACEIAGWLRQHTFRSDVTSRAMTDSSTAVQQAAIDAVRRQAEFAAGAELREELLNATGLRAFTLADALAETADPTVLSTIEDPLCIWSAIGQQPVLLRLHVSKKLEECEKAVRERAERKTRDRRDEID